MKTITITVPDDKADEVQAMLQQYIQQLNISILNFTTSPGLTGAILSVVLRNAKSIIGGVAPS